jgi:hypothetical protein
MARIHPRHPEQRPGQGLRLDQGVLSGNDAGRSVGALLRLELLFVLPGAWAVTTSGGAARV